MVEILVEDGAVQPGETVIDRMFNGFVRPEHSLYLSAQLDESRQVVGCNG